MESECSRPKKGKRVVISGDGTIAKSVSRRKRTSQEEQLEESADNLGQHIAELIELLISIGHPELAVWKYSLRKAEMFGSLASARIKNKLKAEAIAMRMAQAEAKAFTKYMEFLEEE